MKNYYNPDRTNMGLEARWEILDKKVHIEIEGTNCLSDWIDNVIGAFATKRVGRLYLHRKWYLYAFKFYRHIRREIQEDSLILIRGHSMGGAVGHILEFIFMKNGYRHVLADSYGSPSPFENDIIATHVNPGDIVPYLPPWYTRPGMIVSTKKKQGFIKAHLDYDWRF